MATYHTCDRCGRPCGSDGNEWFKTVKIEGWRGDGSIVPPRTEEVNVAVKARIRTWEDQPDLCHLCQIDILLAVVEQVRAIDDYNRRLDAAKRGGIYTVQVLDEHSWHDCKREDIQDLDGNPHVDIPARFPLLNEAENFIVDMRGLMHMGGDDTQFRVVHTDQPDLVVLVAATGNKVQS